MMTVSTKPEFLENFHRPLNKVSFQIGVLTKEIAWSRRRFPSKNRINLFYKKHRLISFSTFVHSKNLLC